MGVSGQVKTPGCWEFEPGITVRQLVYGWGGGPLPGRKVKAVIPGGLSMPVLTNDEPFLLFFAAVMSAAAFGGLGPGLLATILSACCDNYFFVAPFNQFGFSSGIQRLANSLKDSSTSPGGRCGHG